MIPFRRTRDARSGEDVLEVALQGSLLLDHPFLNKGSGFSADERRDFQLEGLLPPHISSWEEQLARTYGNFQQQHGGLEKFLFLNSLQDRNETLYYGLVQAHIAEMMPIIYTPVVGDASVNFSRIFRRPRGLFLSYPDRDRLDSILAHAPNSDTEVIVVTDGERILGLGDLGMNGMGIPVGKLALYTLCAGIHPTAATPIVLDVGTDNKALREDPLYLGWRHERVRGADYDAFIEAFVQAVMKRFPKVLLQWEDFSKANAGRLLAKYRDRLCTFNDDIQGTGAVTLAGLVAAVRVAGEKLRDQRVVILGAGSAATGIADQIMAWTRREGLTEAQARDQIWLVDTHGLVHTDRPGLEESKRSHAQPTARVADWPVKDRAFISLDEVVRHAHPTALIGTSAQPGVFTESIVRDMAAHVRRPIIFPLSNPTSKSEAIPEDLLRWTEGRAVVATGSPFPDVVQDGKTYRIGQCNNAYIFPGVGLGVTASGARRVTDAMFLAAAGALADRSPATRDPGASLFPPLDTIREVSLEVARAVAREAQSAGLAETTPPEETERRIRAKIWTPRYARYRPAL
jgi:malate dehydrogenase (oxaloacetate-decarboxylating)